MRKQQESLQTRKQIEKKILALITQRGDKFLEPLIEIQDKPDQPVQIDCQNKVRKNQLGRRITILVRWFKDQLNQVTGNNHQPHGHLTQQQGRQYATKRSFEYHDQLFFSHFSVIQLIAMTAVN